MGYGRSRGALPCAGGTAHALAAPHLLEPAPGKPRLRAAHAGHAGGAAAPLRLRLGPQPRQPARARAPSPRMKARRISRAEGLAEGMVLAQDVRDASGAVIVGKGTVLGREALGRAGEAPWTELHVVEMEPGDVHEDEGGRRIAAAMAGPGVEASKTFSTGAFSLTATKRGLFEVDAERLGRLNEIEDVAAFALPHRRVVVEGEVVARTKIVPFVTREDRIRAAEEEARGVVRVREFVPLRVTV